MKPIPTKIDAEKKEYTPQMWIAENGEVIAFFKAKGFNLQNTDPKSFSDVIFFEKDVDFAIDLGEDIKDEFLERPPNNNNIYPKEILDKYLISISDYCYNNRWESKISRKHQATLRLRFRFQFNPKYPSDFLMGFSNDIFLLQIPSKAFALRSQEWNLKDFALETIEPIFTKMDKEISEFITETTANIPLCITKMREDIVQWKINNKKELQAKKVLQYLYGALIQFDSLNKRD